jgi:hypothetical protein
MDDIKKTKALQIVSRGKDNLHYNFLTNHDKKIISNNAELQNLIIQLSSEGFLKRWKEGGHFKVEISEPILCHWVKYQDYAKIKEILTRAKHIKDNDEDPPIEILRF